MKTDRARYDDREEVTCRTCGKTFSYPSPMVDDENFRVHHPSCRVPRPIRCIAVTSKDSDGLENVCGEYASFWNPANDLCYCETHQAGLPGLQPITEMEKKIVDAVIARQRAELG